MYHTVCVVETCSNDQRRRGARVASGHGSIGATRSARARRRSEQFQRRAVEHPPPRLDGFLGNQQALHWDDPSLEQHDVRGDQVLMPQTET